MSSTGSCSLAHLSQDNDDGLENGNLRYDVAIAEKSKYSPEICTGKRKVAVCIIIGVIIALCIACIALVIALVLKTEKNTNSKESENFCYTPECLKVASILKQDMNKSFDPCVQFFKYSCDGWIKNNPIGQGEDEQGSMFALSKNNFKKMRFLIESLGEYDQNHPMFKVKSYFFSCMNENAIEKNSLQDFRTFFDRLDKWPVMDDTWSDSWTWVDKIAYFQSKIFTDAPLINLKVMVNPKDTTKYLFQVLPSEIDLKEEYISNNTKALDALLNYMVRIIVLMGGNETNARKQMKDVIEFAIKVAKINPSNSIIYSRWYDMYDVANMEIKTGFPFRRFLRQILKDYNLTLEHDAKMVLPSSQYFSDLVKLLDKTDKRILLNFLMWKVVSKKVLYLSSEFQKANDDFSNEVFGLSGSIPRWSRCIRRLNSPESLTFAMGYLWIDKAFDKDIVPLLKEMFDEIKTAFKDEVRDLSWLDTESRKKSIEKVNTMKDKIGFPALCDNITLLTQYYSKLQITSRDHYIQNVLNISDWFRHFQISKIGRPVDNKEWFMGPQIVNAFYKVSRNEILINAGILQPPFYYGKDAPRAINFGAIGTVLGHELTHGFDSQGSQFNKEGEKRDPWMSDYSRIEFKKRSQCLVNQYNNYYSDLGNGQKIQNDGVQTLAENIADNGGLRLTYRAYKNWVAKHGEEKRIPGLGLTNDQALFLAFGQVYCYTAKPSGIKSRIMTDSHAMPEFRTIGSVSNLESFSKVFSCPSDAPMNPPKKCRVW